jgi:hypothetical protein
VAQAPHASLTWLKKNFQHDPSARSAKKPCLLATYGDKTIVQWRSLQRSHQIRRSQIKQRRKHLMKNLRQIGIALLVMGVMTSFAVAAEKEPDATLRLSFSSVAVGVGFSSGSGTLTYKGKSYPVKVKGLSVGKVGITSSSAHGEVFNLKHLQDFNGHYDVGGAGTRGVTLGAGKAGTLLSNQAGVIVRVSSTQQGVSVNATGGGVDMQLQR